MIIEMDPMISMSKSQFEERLKQVERETAIKVLNELQKEIETHSVYWSYTNRANLIERLLKFMENYVTENNL